MARGALLRRPDRDDAGYTLSVRADGTSPSRRTLLVAAWDGETGALLGRCEITASAGSPLPLSPADLLDRMGGHYRLEAVRVDHALARLSAVTRRVARACARRRRSARLWRRSGATVLPS
ncbi:MAG: hypothetical protein HXX10_24625 [Rhodoplanes sp.]|uniref:hypothetical protein n=1 Tax=Rhodoplanes sp. TaxID=1968906 RepID=UPI0017E3E069|nr:hypothetical protein [Rhodoplanes sp.]NVO17224.1 hypothetical protein [Rhodoplanes sp.]